MGGEPLCRYFSFRTQATLGGGVSVALGKGYKVRDGKEKNCAHREFE